MKIPTYISEQRMSSPMMQTPRVAAPVDLSKAINAIEEQAGIAMQRQQQDWNNYVIAETQTAHLDIDKKYAEIVDRIESGGDYSSAEKEFQDYYNKRIQGSLKNLSQDQKSARLAQIDFDKRGIEYGLNLKKIVRKKTNETTLNSVALRNEISMNRYIKAETQQEKDRILSEIGDNYSMLEASGIIPKDVGKLQYLREINKAKELDLEFVTQQQGAIGGLDFLEKNKDYFSGESYIKARVELENKAFDEQGNALVEAFMNGQTLREPTQDAVDTYVNGVLNSGLEGADLEASISNIIVRTGKVPTELNNTMTGLMSSLPDGVNSGNAAKIASAARIITASIDNNPALVNNKEKGFNEKTRLAARMITDQTAQGVDETTAVKNVLSKLNDPIFSEVYSKSRDDLLEPKNYTDLHKTLRKELKLSDYGVSLVRSDALDIFSYSKAMGMPDDAAEKAMIQELKGRVSKFNGVEVLYSPTQMTSYSSEYDWMVTAQAKLDELYPDRKGKLMPVLYGDNTTVRAKSENRPSSEIPFVLGFKDTNGYVTPAERADGSIVRITASPRMSETPEFVSERLHKTKISVGRFMEFARDRGFSDKDIKNNYGLIYMKFVNSDYFDEKSYKKYIASSKGRVEVGNRLMADLQSELNISPVIAAGIVGNLAHESGNFKKLQEIKPLIKGSRGGYGYAQWTGERRKAFEKWSAENGLDPSSYEANKGFLIYELKNTTEGSVLQDLQNAKTPEEAARIFSDKFLRPKKETSKPETRASLAKRYYGG